MASLPFNEIQRFRNRWALLGIIALNILFGYALFQQAVLDKPFGPKPAPTWVLVAVESFMIMLLLFMRSIRLSTTIELSGIRYRFYPFQPKETLIEWHELANAYMRPYDSLIEYGGWGLRAGTNKRGRAVNTSQSSDLGLQLQFSDGKLLLIGTARPEEMEQALNEIKAEGKIRRGV